MARLLGVPLTSGVLPLHKHRDHFKMVQDKVKKRILCMNPTKYLMKRISENALVLLWVSVLIYYGSSKLIYYDLLIYSLDLLRQDGAVIPASDFGLRH